MIARERGRETSGWALGLMMAGVLSAGPVQAQQAGRAAKPGSGEAQQKVRIDQIDVPGLQKTAVPVNPTDPIAVVNNQVISRQQLSDECVARKGKEILETLINRTLIEQALKSRKQEITAAEIDQEIDSVARRFGIGREAWLRTLDKERGISPMQYARDVIYPALALRKLCTGRVTVTPRDLQDAFESQYGDKLRCRMIMVDKLPTAQAIWEQLRANPGGFEKIAQEQSLDAGSRSLGGLLGEPITRHAYPQNVSDAAFRQLVDGDPQDKDPTHQPKNGDFTGPIQISDSVWVLLRREGVIPGTKGVSLQDERIKKQVYEMIYEVKLKETMGLVFQELIKSAAIENKLVGSLKMANEEQDPDYKSAEEGGAKQLMSNPQGAGNTLDAKAMRTGAQGAGTARVKTPPPAGAGDVVKQFDKLHQRPLKGSTPAVNPAAGADATPASAPR